MVGLEGVPEWVLIHQTEEEIGMAHRGHISGSRGGAEIFLSGFESSSDAGLVLRGHDRNATRSLGGG